MSLNIGSDGMCLKTLAAALFYGDVALECDHYDAEDHELYWVHDRKTNKDWTIRRWTDGRGDDIEIFEGVQGGLDENEEEIWDDNGEYPEPLGDPDYETIDQDIWDWIEGTLLSA